MTGPRYFFLFDLDGTVLDTEFEVSRITAELANSKGCNISAEEVFIKFAGLSCNDKFGGIAKLQGVTLTADDLKELAQKHDATKRLLFGQDDIPVNPGIPELLQRLSDDGHVLSIGSSNRSSHSQLGLTKVGLISYFGSRIYGPDQVNDLKKPNPAIFIYGMKENGASPENTVVVEDTLPGIIAGRAAGAYVIAYLDPRFGTGTLAGEKIKAYKAAGADAVIRSYDDFIKNLPTAKLKAAAPRTTPPRL